MNKGKYNETYLIRGHLTKVYCGLECILIIVINLSLNNYKAILLSHFKCWLVHYLWLDQRDKSKTNIKEVKYHYLPFLKNFKTKKNAKLKKKYIKK